MRLRHFLQGFLLIILLLLIPDSTSAIVKPGYNPPPGIPKNIILLIGDGMGLSQITGGMVANKGRLNLERFPVCGFIKTWSSDNLITDSGAGATAFSTGKKTHNGAIGVDSADRSIPNIFELAKRKKMKTGVVVTCSVTHATPASFMAHQSSRKADEAIAYDIWKSKTDLIIGGGLKFFSSRTDKVNLLDSFNNAGYEFYDKANKANKLKGNQILALVADEHLLPAINRGSFLPDASQSAVRVLSSHPFGYYLMIEGSQIDWAGHANEEAYLYNEMIDFDKAIGKVLDFVGNDKQTLIIVLADHETGGYALTGGDLKTGKAEGKWTTKEHTGTLIPVFAYGPGAEVFGGIHDNTDIYKLIEPYLSNRP